MLQPCNHEITRLRPDEVVRLGKTAFSSTGRKNFQAKRIRQLLLFCKFPFLVGGLVIGFQRYGIPAIREWDSTLFGWTSPGGWVAVKPPIAEAGNRPMDQLKSAQRTDNHWMGESPSIFPKLFLCFKKRFFCQKIQPLDRFWLKFD